VPNFGVMIPKVRMSEFQLGPYLHNVFSRSAAAPAFDRDATPTDVHDRRKLRRWEGIYRASAMSSADAGDDLRYTQPISTHAATRDGKFDIDGVCRPGNINGGSARSGCGRITSQEVGAGGTIAQFRSGRTRVPGSRKRTCAPKTELAWSMGLESRRGTGTPAGVGLEELFSRPHAETLKGNSCSFAPSILACSSIIVLLGRERSMAGRADGSRSNFEPTWPTTISPATGGAAQPAGRAGRPAAPGGEIGMNIPECGALIAEHQFLRSLRKISGKACRNDSTALSRGGSISN